MNTQLVPGNSRATAPQAHAPGSQGAAPVDRALTMAAPTLQAVHQDGRSADLPTLYGRALTRDFLSARMPRLDSKNHPALYEALAHGLGYRSAQAGGQIRHDASYLLPGEGVARATDIVRPQEKRRALLETIPSRSIGASELMVQTAWGAYEGSAALYREGQTQYPRAGASVGASLKQVYTIVTTTMTPWDAVMAGQIGVFNRVAEDAEAARRVMLDYLESALVGGIPGAADWSAARNIPAAGFVSTLDYSSSSTTIGQMFDDLMKMVQAAVEANDDRGEGPTSLLLGNRWARRLMRSNNLDAGGFAVGTNFLAALVGSNSVRGLALENAGINSIVAAPYLKGQGPAGANSSYDMAILSRPDPNGLRWISGMAPAPVRTVQMLDGDYTLWAMRAAGLEAPDAVDVALAWAQVAA